MELPNYYADAPLRLQELHDALKSVLPRVFLGEEYPSVEMMPDDSLEEGGRAVYVDSGEIFIYAVDKEITMVDGTKTTTKVFAPCTLSHYPGTYEEPPAAEPVEHDHIENLSDMIRWVCDTWYNARRDAIIRDWAERDASQEDREEIDLVELSKKVCQE